jgi:hypothetical protein
MLVELLEFNEIKLGLDFRVRQHRRRPYLTRGHPIGCNE